MILKQAIILIFLKLVSVQAVKIVQVGGNGWESYFKHISWPQWSPSMVEEL